MNTTSDNVLLNDLKNESNNSFQTIYKLYFPSIAFYIKQNNGTNEDAEDIFQEAIIVLLQKNRTNDFELSSSLKTYLFAISKNLWLKKLRDNKYQHTDLDISNSFLIETNISIEENIEESAVDKVKSWLLKATNHCQNILNALFVYEETMDSLMKRMGWKNKHTAANQKYKCIEQVKKQAV